MTKPLTDEQRQLLQVRRSSFVMLAAKALLPIAIVAAAVAAYTYLRDTQAVVERRPPQERVWPVTTVAAQFADFRPTVTQFGTIAATRSVDLRTLVAGEVVEVGPSLLDGAEIARGDLLVRIDPFTYQAARDEAAASLAEARARLAEYEARIGLERTALTRTREQLELADRDLARARDLLERGTVSDKTVEDRELIVSQRQQGLDARLSNLEIERARADQQRAAIDRLEWALRRAERDLERTRLVAPFDARVTNIQAELGRYVGLNDTVASLTDRSALDVRFTLPDATFARIADAEGDVVGRTILVVWRAGDVRHEREAVIERVAASIMTETGGIGVLARLAPEGGDAGGALRPGAFVEVRIPDRNYENVVRLPETAIYRGNSVFAVVDGRLAGRAVDIVGQSGTDVLVRGDISEDDIIITTRFSEAGDGVRVEPQQGS